MDVCFSFFCRLNHANIIYFILKCAHFVKNLRKHLFNAPAFAFQVGVDVQVERRADVRVAEQGADGLVVVVAVDATCREGMPEAVEFHMRYADFPEDAVEPVAVGTHFHRPAGVAQDKMVRAAFGRIFQGPDGGGILDGRVFHRTFLLQVTPFSLRRRLREESSRFRKQIEIPLQLLKNLYICTC